MADCKRHEKGSCHYSRVFKDGLGGYCEGFCMGMIRRTIRVAARCKIRRSGCITKSTMRVLWGIARVLSVGYWKGYCDAGNNRMYSELCYKCTRSGIL